jgi:hypothetical protein
MQSQMLDCYTSPYRNELAISAYFVDIFPSALDTTAHMLAYTVIIYILFLNMNNGMGTILCFCFAASWEV